MRNTSLAIELFANSDEIKTLRKRLNKVKENIEKEKACNKRSEETDDEESEEHATKIQHFEKEIEKSRDRCFTAVESYKKKIEDLQALIAKEEEKHKSYKSYCQEKINNHKQSIEKPRDKRSKVLKKLMFEEEMLENKIKDLTKKGFLGNTDKNETVLVVPKKETTQEKKQTLVPVKEKVPEKVSVNTIPVLTDDSDSEDDFALPSKEKYLETWETFLGDDRANLDKHAKAFTSRAKAVGVSITLDELEDYDYNMCVIKNFIKSETIQIETIVKKELPILYDHRRIDLLEKREEFIMTQREKYKRIITHAMLENLQKHEFMNPFLYSYKNISILRLTLQSLPSEEESEEYE
jgi:hypothetical protein